MKVNRSDYFQVFSLKREAAIKRHQHRLLLISWNNFRQLCLQILMLDLGFYHVKSTLSVDMFEQCYLHFVCLWLVQVHLQISKRIRFNC